MPSNKDLAPEDGLMEPKILVTTSGSEDVRVDVKGQSSFPWTFTMYGTNFASTPYDLISEISLTVSNTAPNDIEFSGVGNVFCNTSPA